MNPRRKGKETTQTIDPTTLFSMPALGRTPTCLRSAATSTGQRDKNGHVGHWLQVAVIF